MITGILVYGAADLVLTILVIAIARRNRFFRHQLDQVFSLVIGNAWLKIVKVGADCCPPTVCHRDHVEEVEHYEHHNEEGSDFEEETIQ